MEVSNIYFYLAHYLYFMGFKNKAIACFLVAGQLRKEEGISCLYNTSLILIKQHRYQKAIKYFTIALRFIEKHGDSNKILMHIYEGLAYCYKKLNHFDNTIIYLEKALCENIYSKRIKDR